MKVSTVGPLSCLEVGCPYFLVSFVGVSVQYICWFRYVSRLQTGKDEMCKCGCRGWCSIWVVLYTLAQNLETFSRVQFGVPFIFALMDIKGDWPGWLELIGLRHWNHRLDIFHPDF